MHKDCAHSRRGTATAGASSRPSQQTAPSTWRSRRSGWSPSRMCCGWSRCWGHACMSSGLMLPPTHTAVGSPLPRAAPRPPSIYQPTTSQRCFVPPLALTTAASTVPPLAPWRCKAVLTPPVAPMPSFGAPSTFSTASPARVCIEYACCWPSHATLHNHSHFSHRCLHHLAAHHG